MFYFSYLPKPLIDNSGQNIVGLRSVSLAHRHLRTILVSTLLSLIVVSGSLSVTPPPLVNACNGCNFLLKWGTAGSDNGQFNGPQGVAVDSAGNVYVTDSGDNRVEKFTGTGTFTTTWASPGVPFGVAVDSGGNVYVTDYGDARVEKFTGTGTFITTWGSFGSDNGLFNGPWGIAVDSGGNVYVADDGNNRVQKFTSTGKFITTWGMSGSDPGQFNLPAGVAVDALGNVYVTDSGNSRVERFTNTGTYLSQLGCPTGYCPRSASPGQFNNPVGVAVDSVGNVYVVDAGNDRVEKFASTGTFILTWGSYGSGNGLFNNPLSAAVDSGGTVYVVDAGNDRVELFGDSTSATIPLVAGWNLISLPLIPVNTAIGKVLNDLIVTRNFTIVWSYQGGVWKSFTPPATGTLTTMQDGFGYWIYVTDPFTFKLLGYVIAPASAPPSYSLSAGWNLVGFKPQPTIGPGTVGTYLTSVTGDYSTNNVWLYDNPTATWIRATGSTPIPVGEALWVYMTTPATLRP